MLIFSQDKIMHFPTWVDLKGQDAVPETVHHVVNCGLYQSFNYFGSFIVNIQGCQKGLAYENK